MSQVRCNLAKASSMLFKGLQLKGLQVSAKTIILASTAAEARGLADSVCAATGIKVDAATSARDLGVDRYVNGRRSIRVAKQRIKKARDRADRIRVIKKMTKKMHKVVVLWKTGTYSAATFGHQANGTTPALIALERREAARASGVQGSGLCLDATMPLLFGDNDPAIYMPVQHSLSWLKLAKSVTNVKKLDRVWAIWVKKLSALPEAKRWAHIVGPASSMIALLLNWGWVPTGPTDWTSNAGVRYNMDPRIIVTSRSCASFVHDLQHFLKQRILATAAKRKCAEGLAKKPVLAYWSRLRTKWESSGQHALATCALKVVAGGAWNMERKHRCGLAPSPICDLCADNVVQDEFHVSWQCPAIRAHALLDGWNDIGLEAKAHREAGRDPTLWLRGVPQQFEDINPGAPPDDWAEITIGTDVQQDWPPGLYYSDASGGPFSAYPEVRRIAYGAMRMNDPNGDGMYNWQQPGSLVAFIGALPWESKLFQEASLLLWSDCSLEFAVEQASIPVSALTVKRSLMDGRLAPGDATPPTTPTSGSCSGSRLNGCSTGSNCSRLLPTKS